MLLMNPCGELLLGFRRERAVVLADASDAIQKMDPFEVAVDQPDRGEQAQDEHGGQHDGNEGHEQPPAKCSVVSADMNAGGGSFSSM